MEIKRDFIFDPSLVLYLPLYKLDDASFMSKDAYGHLCTVTGALWRPGGRYFDGTDDKIYCVAGSETNLKGAILIWFKTNTTATMALFCTADEHNNIRWLEFGIDSDVLRVSQKANDTEDIVSGATNITDGNWHLGGLVSNGTAWSIYLDGNRESLTVDGGFNTGDWFGDTPNRDNITVGVNNIITPKNFYAGLIGETWIYSRALTPLEIYHNYLATKWRYR